MAGTCPENPTPPPSCGTGPCDDAMPFDAATGAVEQTFSFVPTNFGSFDVTWYNLYESGGNPDNPNRGLGTNWSARQFAEVLDDGNGQVCVMFAPGRNGCGGGPGGGGGDGGPSGPGGGGGGCGSGDGIRASTSNTYWFAEEEPPEIPGPQTYGTCFGCLATLTRVEATGVMGDPPDDYRLVEVDGTVTVFDGTNKLIKSQTTPGGQVTEYFHSSSPDRISEMRRTFEYGGDKEAIESRLFEYSGGNLQYVTFRRATNSTAPISWVNIRRTEFVYYTSNETSKGNIGDLKLIKQQLPAAGSTWTDDKIQLFRYYTSSENDGYQHGLKYVLSPEGYERMTDPQGSTNAQLAPFVTAFYEYDVNRRVKTVATEGGQVTNTVVFSENTGLTNFDYNNWLRKAVITMPDGLVKTVYSNHIGQDLLVDDKDGDDHWITNWIYNGEGRLEQMVHPSAIDLTDSYDEGVDDLDVNIKTNAGLINVYTYYSSNGSGGAAGYPEYERVKKGSGGTEINIRKTEYFNRVVDEGTETETRLNPVSEIEVFRNDAGSLTAVTTVEYTWHSGTVQMETATTTLPIVPSGENGDGLDDEITRTYDIQGRLIELEDARGTKTTYAYSEDTGAPVEMVQDSGSGGLQLTTDVTNDDLGRQTESLGPEHAIDGQTVRTARWTVYKDDIDEIWTGQGYKTGSTYILINPVSIIKMDKNSRVTDSIQATRGSGVEDSGKLTASDTFARASWIRWNRSEYGDGGRMTSAFRYFAIPSFGNGSTTFYDETQFNYDSVGRQNMVKTPAGTITRTVYDVRSLVDNTWVGTNDAGETDADPSNGGTSPNNMKKVTQNEYDGGVDGGDGNLTKLTRPVDDTSANDRVTEMEYDWRDRLVTTIIDDGTNQFHIIETLDNLGRAIVSETKRDDSSSLVLIGMSETKFDSRGRVFQTLSYGVDDSGTLGNDLVSNTWFDANNNVLESKPSGSTAFTKTVYDAINRPIESYYGYYDGTGSDSPNSLVDNVIFSQSATVYDGASNQIRVTSKERNHDATGTGALNGPAGSQPKSRDSYVFNWFDEIGRTTESANYGTNGGSAPTRSSTPPSSSDTILVSQRIYNADGEIEDVVDPLGKVDRSVFDAAGRLTKITMNHGSTPTEVTNTEYDKGRVSKQIAENSITGNQDTAYTYGVTTTNSKLASNELLQTMTYPDTGDVSYEYNRQGQQIKMTDQNDTVHAYEYDELGRIIEDRVTLAGGSKVDNSVLRIETTYDDRMRMEMVTSYDAATGGNVVNDVLQEYDDFDQLSKEYQQHGSVVNTGTSPNVQYAYENGSNNNIRLTSMTYPTSSRVLNYDYGATDGDNDQLSRVEKLKIGTSPIVDYDYLGMNRVAIQKYTEPSPDLEYTIVTGSGNDPYTALDRFGRTTNLLWQQSSSRIRVNYNYTYDRIGNKLTQKVNGSPAPTNVDELYAYDALYRLTQYDRGELVSGSITNPTLTQEWSLDQVGNWNNFEQGVVDALNQDREFNKVNEITNITETVGASWPTPVYDANGNMTEMPQPNALGSKYDATWDAWNRLVKLVDGSDTVVELAYDGLSRRIVKKNFTSGSLSETRHCYYSNRAQCLEERIDTSTDAAEQFIWGIRFVDDLILRDRDTNNNGTLDERLYALCDPRFSILAITDSGGTVQERYDYSGYGRTSIYTPAFADRTSSSFAWEFRYTGRREDLETGLYYFRARYFHAQLGQFVSRDPFGYADGMSLYRGYFIPNKTDSLGQHAVDVLGNRINCAPKHCCPLTGEVPEKCLDPKKIKKADGCKYNDKKCFTIIDKAGNLQSWPISCVCKFERWADDDVTTCIRGCIQCVVDSTGKTPNQDAHDECIDACIHKYKGPWTSAPLVKVIILALLTESINECIEKFSPNGNDYPGFVVPPPEVDCVGGELIR